ncbi:TrlF family AAA-like ATPase [Propionispira raffinosivorans]|uniref:TrlF family AAA-like ATPase n=1 Tax=Propionispira raffinosivorans TaxID=86959 RepID=UPI00037CA196|nr:PHP domain-containing protein [Propionispira raffinosivorans]
MSISYDIGSEWRKWDLHLHTPSSYDYKDKSVTNQDIIDKLVENEISVAAVTDHHVMNIQQIKELQELGSGKVTILPGIEFLSDAQGKDPVHFIAVFPEDSNIEYIWGQIKNKTNINQIEGKGKKINEVYCDLLDTIALVHELGGITTIHSGQKSNSIDKLPDSVNHIFAQKKDIAEKIDLFEIGVEKDQDVYKKYAFPVFGKPVPMIICSDNHKISEYVLKAYCWIKADPTFNGLKQAIYEPKTRIYIGIIPPKVNEFNNNKSKYLRSIKIVRSDEDYPIEWFSAELPLNSGLIAIIGNKGSGKSALGDIIALVGKSKQEENFSFLHKERFRKAPERKAQNFSATLTWSDGRVISKNLNDNVALTDIEEVQYLPQKFIETVCNGLDDEFKTEINRIVFSYLPEEKRLQKRSFDELIEHRCNAINSRIQTETVKLKESNTKIIKLEKMAVPDYKENIEKQLKLKKETREAIEKNKPKDVIKPVESIGISDQIQSLADQIKAIQQQINEKQNILNRIVLQISAIDNVIEKVVAFKTNIQDEKNKLQEELSKADIHISIVLDLIIDTDSLNNYKETLYKQKEKLDIFLNKDGIDRSSLFFQEQELEKQKSAITQKMSTEQQTYHKYVEELASWKKQCDNFIVEEKELQSNLDYLNAKLGVDLKIARANRLESVKRIYQGKQEEAQIYQEIYEPVLEYINLENSPQNATDEILNFTVTKKLKKSFVDEFLGYIKQSVLSDFKGVQEGRQKVKDIIENYDFNKEDGVINFIDEFYQSITQDLTRTDIIVKNRSELYNFLFGLNYLDVSYELKLGAAHLEQLSPGEKGALLLIFYLFLDKSKLPLIIDQPEDNLDNYSVFNHLVPYIRKAKERRQVIIITHNPNLAVACDTEQIIYAKMDKQNSQIFYESGSIENPDINKHIVDVLEGTMPAFTLRRIKYFN